MDPKFKDLFDKMRQTQVEQKEVALEGRIALQRLVIQCKKHIASGQILRVRDFLYSLFNGQPASLNDIQTLDWELRQNLALCILACGCPGFPDHCIRTEFKSVGLETWFLEAYTGKEEAA